MSYDKELKPCPFCGNEEVLSVRYNVGGMLQVSCIFCSATGPEEKNRHEAIESWNTRAK